MKLLITRSKCPHFYEIESEVKELKPVNFGYHELCQPDWDLNRSLPDEITSLIFKHLFVIYLKSFNFDLAAALVTVHKTFAKDIYEKVFGKTILAVTTKINRLCNTLNFMEQLHDDYLTVDRISTYTMCRVVRKRFGGKVNPWDLVHECFPTQIASVITDGSPVHQYATGTMNGENVWVTGSYLKNGIFECQRFKHPVINLEFTNVHDFNLCTSTYLRRSHSIKQLVELLRVTYGPNTGVNIMFNNSEDGNPFDMSATGFIEY